jgi:hypothetical protein
VPVGYLVSVALVTLFALVPLRAVGNLSFRLGLLLNEVPILGFYWLVADTSLAFAEGDISSAGGWATVGLAALTTAGLAVIAWRGLRARPVLEQAMAEALGADWRTAIDPGLAARLRRRLPVARILLLPLSRRGRGVERVANIRYGDAGRRNLLDLYRSRARPSGGPVLIHLHGGGYTRGRKNSQSLPLLYRLASQGWVSSPLAYARADARRSSSPTATTTPSPPWRRSGTSPTRWAASPPIRSYSELPGAQHAFDLFHSLRYEMVVDAVEAFTAWVRSRQPRDLRVRVERAKGIEPSPRAWEARVLPLNYARRRGDSSRAV